MLSSWGRFLELSDEEEGPLVIITTKDSVDDVQDVQDHNAFILEGENLWKRLSQGTEETIHPWNS